MSVKQWRKWFVPLSMLAIFTLSSVYFQGKPRYMAPFYPLLVVFFAAAALKIKELVWRLGKGGVQAGGD